MGDRTNSTDRHATANGDDYGHAERRSTRRQDADRRPRRAALECQRSRRHRFVQRSRAGQPRARAELFGRRPRQPAWRRESGPRQRLVHSDRTPYAGPAASPGRAGGTACSARRGSCAAAGSARPRDSRRPATSRSSTSACSAATTGSARARDSRRPAGSCSTGSTAAGIGRSGSEGAGRLCGTAAWASSARRRASSGCSPSAPARAAATDRRQRATSCSCSCSCAGSTTAGAAARRATARRPGTGGQLERRADRAGFDRAERRDAELHARGRPHHRRDAVRRPGEPLIRGEADRHRSYVFRRHSGHAVSDHRLSRHGERRSDGTCGGRRAAGCIRADSDPAGTFHRLGSAACRR